MKKDYLIIAVLDKEYHELYSKFHSNVGPKAM